MCQNYLNDISRTFHFNILSMEFSWKCPLLLQIQGQKYKKALFLPVINLIKMKSLNIN